MSDSIDKFVLQYSVDLRDSIARLEKLQANVDRTAKKSDQAGKTLDNFSGKIKEIRGAADEASQGLGGMMSVATRMGPVFGAAAIGIGGMIAALRLASKESERLNEQMAKGFSMGMHGINVEVLSRNLSAASGGRLTRAGGLSLAEKIGGQVTSAYMDPMQNNAEALRLRRAGLSTVNAPGGGMVSTQDAMIKLSKEWQGLAQNEIDARGRLLGLQQDEIAALQGYAAQTEANTAMTQAEAEQKLKAYEAAKQLQQAENKLSEQWAKFKEQISAEIIPAVSQFMTKLNELQDSVKKGSDPFNAFAAGLNAIGDAFQKGDKGGQEAFSEAYANARQYGVDYNGRAKTKEQVEEGKKPADQKMLDQLDENNRQSKSTADQFTRAVSQFSSATASFGGHIDEQQAWAAWAGAAGAASGLNGAGPAQGMAPGTITHTGNGLPQSTNAANGPATGAYADIISAAAAKHGVSAAEIAAIMQVESKGNPLAKSPAGAQGLMQLMPSIQKAYGITNPFDPEQNIMGGARLIAELKAQGFKGDDLYRAYNAGPNRARWNNKETQAYPGLVNAALGGAAPAGTTQGVRTPRDVAFDPNAVHPVQFSGGALTNKARFAGEGQMSLLQQQLIGNVAAQIGIPAAQLRSGSVSNGDVQYGLGNFTAGLTNRYNQISQQLQAPGLMPQEKQRLIQEQQQAQMGIYAKSNHLQRQLIFSLEMRCQVFLEPSSNIFCNP